jgi:hypothetical protein
MGMSIVAIVVVSAALGQAAEPPSMTESQREQVAALARNTQQESARLKQALAERQQELAELYTHYELDTEKLAQLETEILDLQKKLLGTYREMQVELRSLVNEDRFQRLKRRLDNLLEKTAPTATAPAPPDAPAVRAPEEQVFSGPQVGEELPAFKVQGVFGEAAGKELDFVTAAEGKPLVLVFVHDVNRPSIALTRSLTKYTAGRAADGLHTGVVWLSDDATEAENTLRRMQHALTAEAPLGISLDGKEGPGSYGLNRNVTLTVLVAKDGKVTANFALVQPSLQADLPKILEAVVAVAGGTAPPISELIGQGAMRREDAEDNLAELRELLRPVIQRTATEAEVDEAAAAVEKYVAENEAARREVGRIANTIIDAGKLTDYGTPRAQEFLTKWAKEFGKPEAAAPDAAR